MSTNYTYTIIDYDPTFYYALPNSEIHCLPFEIKPLTYATAHIAHSTFFKNQAFSIRFWASKTPAGPSISLSPSSIKDHFNPGQKETILHFYDLNMDQSLVPADALRQWLYPNTRYYMNIQNLETKQNGFYIKWENIVV